MNLDQEFNSPQYFVQRLIADKKEFEKYKSDSLSKRVHQLKSKGYVDYKDGFAVNFKNTTPLIDKMECINSIAIRDGFAGKEGEKNSYVYLWKHMNGDVFYVGSGTGKRSTAIKKNDKFLSEMDKGDSVVYIVASGLKRYQAFVLEAYVSNLMSLMVVNLANEYNVVNTKKKKYDFMSRADGLDFWLGRGVNDRVNCAIQKILRDRNFSRDDAMTTAMFLSENGLNYFSQKFQS